MKYYHITPTFDNWISIMENGLIANQEGYIYLLTNKEVAGYVALNQLGCYSNYFLLEINEEGLDVITEPDLVGEITAKYQVRIKQEVLHPKFIGLIGAFKFEE